MASQPNFTILLILCSTPLYSLLGEAEAAFTDKDEIGALRTIVQLGMANWDLNLDPCTDKNGVPNSSFQGLGCDDCSDLNKSVCHVTNITLRSHNLTGVLSPELGNLSHLQQLDLTDNNLTGPIPPQLGFLKFLKILRLSSNQFTGKIPSTFTNLQNLTELILQGTSLEGPILSSISKLISLEDLRISDIAQGGDSLEDLRDLTNLRILVLRNNNMTGKIPVTIGTGKFLYRLETLDLSFNNLTGSIPESLNSLPSLQYLFLGNNSLSGILPDWLNQFADKITIDLSYNNFSGNIPEEFARESSKVNLKWNSLSPRDHRDPVDCLQRNFPCGKREQNYGFAINCGGQKLGEFDGDDNDLVNVPSFFGSPGKKWGVSNVGHFIDAEIQPDQSPYIAKSNATFLIRPHNNTVGASPIDAELYRTARISPTSLRYYGLDLHNGLYSVELHFAEIQYPGTQASTGVRIFDVYIQGDRKLKDFNIREAAGGQYLAVVMNYTINVTENFLDIHFFWAGKGTCCEPQDVYGPLVSAIKVTPQFKVPKDTKTVKKVVISVVVVIILGLLLILSLVFIKKRKKSDNILSCLSKDKSDEGNSFSLRMIKTATKNFDPKNKIGEGGFGAVYKGILPDGRKVAIKQLSTQSKQGNSEFLNEVGTISVARHPDLVKLYGCCVEGEELILVYEYMENGNLAQALFGQDEPQFELNWATRYKICLGVARGLAYLHEESLLKIIHRDIKSTNILLDKHLNPKVADFGLARLFDEETVTHVTTRVAGTIGYLAPEYALRGHLTDKADVYSFGVLLLEIVSGRSHTNTSLEEEKTYLLEWAWHLYEEKKILQLADARLLYSGYNEEEVVRIIHIGLLCTHENPGRRPFMSAIVEMLEGRMETPTPQSRPAYLNHWQTWQLAAGVPHEQIQSSASNISTHNYKGPSKESSSSSKQTLSLE